MPYVPPFNAIKERVRLSSSGDNVQVTVDYKSFLLIIRDLLRGVTVDEEWYLKRYPDVVQSGMTARQHFAEHGYFEGRLPSELTINESWYLKTNLDVAAQVAAGEIPDGLTHFRDHGYSEGRLPDAY